MDCWPFSYILRTISQLRLLYSVLSRLLRSINYEPTVTWHVVSLPHTLNCGLSAPLNSNSMISASWRTINVWGTYQINTPPPRQALTLNATGVSATLNCCRSDDTIDIDIKVSISMDGTFHFAWIKMSSGYRKIRCSIFCDDLRGFTII